MVSMVFYLIKGRLYYPPWSGGKTMRTMPPCTCPSCPTVISLDLGSASAQWLVRFQHQWMY